MPADGELPGGRFVVSRSPAGGAAVSDPLERLLAALDAAMPRDEVEAVWVFPPVRREGQEHGVAVVSRVAIGERRRVYRARYIVVLKGPERGKVTVALEETAEAPAALLPAVLDGVQRRADEAGEAEPVDLTAWKAGEGERSSGPA